MIKRKRFQAGEPVENFTADDYNAIVAEIERLSKLGVSAPLSLATSETGRVLGMTLYEPFWATLSGSSSPYSFVEAIHQAGDTWVAGYQTGASNACEANGHAGLNGQRVLLRATEAGDWVFQWMGYAPPGFAWTFNVRGCASTGVAGALIELRQSGVLIDSCTTGDGTGGTTLGRCVLTVPAGSYDITITGPSGAGFAVHTSTASIAGTKTTTTSLAADSSHICWSCCNTPLPMTFSSTDSDGPITLTYDPASGSTPRYTLITSTEVSSACENTGSGCFGCQSPATIELRYTLTFNASCIVQLGIGCRITCCASGVSFLIGGSPQNPIPNTSGTFDCDTFVGTFSAPTTFTASIGICSGTLPVPGGGGLFVFTP